MKVANEPIMWKELVEGAEVKGLSKNYLFAAPDNAQAPSTEFEGTLKLEGTHMGTSLEFSTNKVHGKDITFFPDVSLKFFTVDDKYLVPVTQDVIPNGTLENTRSYWDIIVQPGRVWSNFDQDNGWNRASFPFSLVNRLEGETHIGIAMFLYKKDNVSHVRFQIVAETGPFDVSGYFNAWGVTKASYIPGGIDNLEYHKYVYRRHLENRFPTAPLDELKQKVGDKNLAAFNGAKNTAEEKHVLQTGLFYKGVLYRSPCHFAAGPFPYGDEIRYGVWSVTKTAMMNVAMLRLAEKYGRGLLDDRISNYIQIPESQKEWNDVTYLDMSNMASGRGATEDDPTCYLCDYHRWYLAPSKNEKVSESLDYPMVWEPGTKYNYRDQDAFLLGVALEKYLQSKEGEDATLDQLLKEEVYEPIGIYYKPVNHTIEENGSSGHPRMDFGYHATLDELAKIALLYENHGKWNGNQILNRELVDSVLPKQEPPSLAISKEENNAFGPKYYAMNWHIEPYCSSEGHKFYLPNMKGYGGNLVTLMPGQVVGFRMANALTSSDSDDFDSTVPQAIVGSKLVSFGGDNDKINND
ncbi:beta-lactamase family protein [Lentibacillus cibarius]|uniref:Beta-lactamase family protein n=1 Tax=Lentibacillus cibarius TaxID=2583219 RepID=A0A549YBH4_9BACI|nr:serine hydrolase [Lentibacillus cibarius]TRM09230.1 beta-lactamase family protein [Lentibacillus cibarius]TRM11514.1 beta-lactamase family protein [Lentibacillus cibarius]